MPQLVGLASYLRARVRCEVELRDLVVTGGSVGRNGGGIFNFGTLTLRGVTVRGNATTQGGGGICNADGILILESGTRVESNTAQVNGGGIANNVRGTVTLRNGSRVENNRAAVGGGIHNTAGSVTLDPGSVVTGNSPDNCEFAIGTCT